MTRTITKDNSGEISPMLRSLLERQLDGSAMSTSTALALRQNQVLDRRAIATVQEARKRAGVELEYLGVQPMFTKPRLYEAEPNDWVLGPVVRRADLVVPKAEQAVLRRLVAEDIDFAMTYVAHEVQKEKTAEIVRATDTIHTDIDAEKAAEIVGPVPDPHQTVELGERLGRRTGQVLRTVRRGAVVGGAVVAGAVAAPVVLAGAALAGLAQLDPIILGAMPLGEPREGQPAAWFVLARWDW